MTTNHSHAAWRTAPWLIWSYLGLLGLAEALTTVYWPSLGIVLYAVILIILPIHAGLADRAAERQLTLGLTLIPVVRLLSLSLILSEVPTLVSYAIIGVQLLVTLTIISRFLGVSRSSLGIHSRGLIVQVMLGTIGVSLGVIKYAIDRPAPLVGNLSWPLLVLSGVVLMLYTVCAQELVFRGLLQPLALSSLGRWGILFTSILFAMLQIGTWSFANVVYTFGLGLLFAYVVYWSGSIIGVALAHSLANITSYIVLPLILIRNPAVLQEVVPYSIWSAFVLSAVAVTLLIRAANVQGRLLVGALPMSVVPEAIDAAADISTKRTARTYGFLSRS